MTAADDLTAAAYSDALTPEEAKVIIDAGFDPERILAFLFGDDDD